jgi:hypothetical protein
LGLLINLIGVYIVYWHSKRVINPDYFELQKRAYLAKIVDWGIRLVVIGTALQLIGAFIYLARGHL